MDKYKFTDDMGEISGFGGSYEAACKLMVLVGLEWLDENQGAEPIFKEYKNTYGMIDACNPVAEQLEAVILKACPNCTSAMMQACINAVLYIKNNGWDKYAEEMRKKKGA